MSKALESVAASDFAMVRDNDNQVITVKSATLDTTDKTKVKLVVFTSLTDAKTYTVTYTANDAAKTQSTKQITVTDGKVADVAITPLEITANKVTEIYYQTIDANGVVVSEKPVFDKSEAKVDVTCDTLLGTLDNNTSELILYNVGDTATFTVTYHTYKYDGTTGAELDVIKKPFTVTAVKDATVISQYAFTVATEKPYDWSKVTPVTTVALGDGTDGFADRYAYFMIKDAKGNDVTGSCGYTVESSDNSKVVADGSVGSATGVLLKPVSVGSAYLMIKDTDGKVVSTLPITVGEKRKLSVFKLNTNTVTIATDAAVDDVTTGYAEVTAKDQYGVDIPADNLFYDYTVRTANTGVTLALGSNASHGKKTIQVSATDASEKTGVYTITASDTRNNSMSTTLNVVTKAPKAGNDTYSVVFLNDANKVVSSISTTVKEATGDTSATSSAIKAVIVKKNGGVVIASSGAVTATALKVTRNGKVEYNVVSGSAATTTCAAISVGTAGTYTGTNKAADMLGITVTSKDAVAVTSSTNPLKKFLTAGSYTVQYTITVNGVEYKPYATLTVTDDQTAVTARIQKTNVSGSTAFSSVVEDKAYAKFYYGDVELAVGDYYYVSADKVINNNGKNVYVKSVTIKVKAASSSNWFVVEVPVNKTFTRDTDWTDGNF